MRACVCRLAATAAFMLVVNAAAAQDKIRIGLIYTLSGAPSTLGQQSKNGFELALKNLGGKMGGKDVELLRSTMSSSQMSRFRKFAVCSSVTASTSWWARSFPISWSRSTSR